MRRKEAERIARELVGCPVKARQVADPLAPVLVDVAGYHSYKVLTIWENPNEVTSEIVIACEREKGGLDWTPAIIDLLDRGARSRSEAVAYAKTHPLRIAK